MAGSNPYANLIEQQALASGGYAALPQIQRSQYLADALKALQESAGQNIKTPAALGSNLLAAALLKYGENRSQKSLLDALGKQSQAQVGGDMSQVFGDQTPAAPAPSPAPANFAAPPAPSAGVGFASAGAAPPTLGAPPPGADAGPAQRMIAALIKGGLNPMGAAGLVGNFRAESGPNFNLDNPREGAIGAANWRGDRAAAAQAYFAANGGPTPENQAAFALQELHGPESRAYRALQSATDPQSAAAAGTMYERPAGFGGPPAGIAGWGTRLSATQGYAPGQNNPPPPPAPPPQMGAGGAPPVSAPQQPQGQQAPPAGSTQAAVQTELPILYGEGANPVEKTQIMQGLQAPVGSARYMEAAARLHEIAIRMSQQRPYDIQMVNGVPTAFDKDSGRMIPLAIPDAVRTRTVSAGQDGAPNAPAGTSFNVAPTGGATVAYQPPAGYQATNAPGQPYTEGNINGGPAQVAQQQQQFQNSTRVRDEYTTQVTPFLGQQSAYQSILATQGDASHAAQVARIVALARLINPQARVGSPEQAVAATAGTDLGSFIATSIAKLSGGENNVLSPEEDAAGLRLARNIYSAAKSQADATYQRYRGLDPTLSPIPDLQDPTVRTGVGQYQPASGVGASVNVQGQPPTHNNTAAGGRRLSPQEAAQLPRGTHFVGMDGIDRVRQ